MRKALVLTPTYAHHKVVSWQTAITLVYLGKVEVIAEYDEVVRSPSVAMALPAVLRLRRPPPARKKVVPFSRANVYLRDDYRCQYCAEQHAMKRLTLDHVVAKSRGGRKRWDNVVTACRPCNTKKGNRTPHEAGMTLLRLPERPKHLPAAVLKLNPEDKVPEEWEPYVRKEVF